MGEIIVANVIPPLDNVLEDILHIPEIARRYTLSADFIKSLTAEDYVLLNAGIALPGKHPSDIARIRDSETVWPFLILDLPGKILVTVCDRRSLTVTVLTDDLKHCGFACADVSPKPKPLVRVIPTFKLQTPPYYVVEERLHILRDPVFGANLSCNCYEFKFLLPGYVS